MEQFKQELRALLLKYPDVESITYTTKESFTVDRTLTVNPNPKVVAAPTDGIPAPSNLKIVQELLAKSQG